MEIQTLHQNIHWDPVAKKIPGPNFNMDDDDFESGNSTAKLYERSRIKALAEEREVVQKKTFTKWVNSHLSLVKCQIEDLYMDLRDGKMLLKLLEILSGERLPKPTRGKMRIHCLENVDKAINFLTEQHVQFSNVGPHDIVDGNNRLTLGLIWTIILRFQIQDIMIEEYQTSETRSAKDALLLWCQMKTAGYNNVNVRNFTTSWRDGLAFNALIHKHRPDLIDYPKLKKTNAVENLEAAFGVANENLGVASILDSKDVNVEQPDEKSIITYVATLYHAFNNQKAQSVQSKRIGKVINQAAESQHLVNDYERITSDLLEWINKTIELLKERTFANSLSGVQQQLAGFKTYRTVEKPGKFSEKGALEVLLFTIQSKMRANNQIPYTPAEGKLIADINKAWENLEKEEHLRELAIRDELIRQEKLEQLALRFYRKAGMREAWLSENQRLVAQENFGSDLAAVEAATKKHEAIETDIYAYEERVKAVVNVANDLEVENFHAIEAIQERQAIVLTYWKNLIEIMTKRRMKLNLSLEVHKIFQEIIHIEDWIEEIRNRLKSPDLGGSLMEVEDLIQKQGLLEADIRMLETRKNKILDQAKIFIDGKFNADVGDYRPVDPDVVVKKGNELKAMYDELLKLSEQRKKSLSDAKIMWEFFSQMEGEKEWIREKSQLMSNPDLGHDLSSVERLQRKHRALEEECQTRQAQIKATINDGVTLINAGNQGADNIKNENIDVEKNSEQLVDLIAERKQRLKESQEFFQLMADCDDMDAMLNEIDRIVKNDDVGTKLSVTESLIKSNQETLQNLEANKDIIHQLNSSASRIADYPESNANALNERINKLNEHYKKVNENAMKREERLKNAISMYKLFDVSDTVRTWVTEKEKLISTLVPGEDLSELEVVRHRFECFEKELKNNAEKVSSVNQLSESAVKVEHPDSGKIQYQQDSLNTTWNDLTDIVEKKKKAIDVAYRYNQFLTEATETSNWIKEKAKLVESTDELGNDLEGIMQLQRRLGGLQRDLQAIQAKLDHMDKEVENLSKEKPEAVPVITQERKNLHKLWGSLNEMLKERDDRLNDSSELQKFLLNLDHFQLWLTKMKTTIASEDVPQTLQETEKKIGDFEHLKNEIDAYDKDFNDLMTYGRKVTDGQTDAQYVFLTQRLNGMEEDWDTLQKMYDDRLVLLKQAAEAQSFFRDANQIEAMFGKQENFLSKEDVPASHDVAQEFVRNFENFQSSLVGNDDRVNNVLNNGLKLSNNNSFLVDKIKAKCEAIKKRREEVDRKANEKKEQLNQQLKLQEIYQEIDDVEEWISEKSIVASEVPEREKKNIAAIYSRFKAFESELEANKDKLDNVVKQAEDTMKEHPHLADQIEPRLNNLKKQWNDLNQQTIDKSAKMADANREQLFDETAKSMMTWITEIKSQVVTTTEETTEEIGLVEINEQMKEQDRKDQELAAKRRLLQDMQQHAEKLKEQYPERREEFEQVHQEVRFKLTELEAPLNTKRDKLLKQKRVRQFLRDIDDERDWIGDKQALVRDPNTRTASSLLGVQQLQRRHRMLSTEVENHEPRIDSVCKVGEEMIQEGHPQSDKFRASIDALWNDWDSLKKSVKKKQDGLEKNEAAQQYLFDASESEAWMGEQELYLMGEERAKDEQSVSNATKKHEQMQRVIEKYGEEIRSLGERTRLMIDSNHPEAEIVANKQARVDKMYAGLQDLCMDKKNRLEELTKLYHLLKEIHDLEAWIAERTQLASNHESGTDYEHNCVLRDRFSEFARETNELGKQRIAAANDLCNSLIDQGHAEAAEIAECKDRINEAWADLLELIETRIQLLKTAWDLHKFLCECQDVLDRINEKTSCIPEDIGKDAKAVAGLQRKHAAFESQLERLGKQVEEIKNQANVLLPSYANDRERLICDKREEVLHAWRQLNCSCDQRKSQLHNASDIHRFFAMCRKLRSWMAQMRSEMAAKEKPRDVSGVDLLMNNHRSLKAEIDAREENFSVCLSLGRTLLNRRHPRMEEVRQNCIDLVTERIHMFDEWTDRLETLQLMLEVYQFAREAAVAEAWLYAQEPYLNSQDLGESLDETLALLKKHLAFEKTAATQEERFEALKKLTTLELKARERTPESEAIRKKERDRKIAEAVKEFIPVPVSHSEVAASPMTSTTTAPGGHVVQRNPAGTPKRMPPGTPIGSRQRDSVDGQPIPADCFGLLWRKNEWENEKKKASNRSWHQVYAVLNKELSTLSFYDNEQTFKTNPLCYYKGEAPMSITNFVAAPADDYTKKPNVFRLKFFRGGQSLFRSQDQASMYSWVGAINGVAKQNSITPKSQHPREASEPGPSSNVSKTRTLPTEHKEESSRNTMKSRFLTMNRKSKK